MKRYWNLFLLYFVSIFFFALLNELLCIVYMIKINRTQTNIMEYLWILIKKKEEFFLEIYINKTYTHSWWIRVRSVCFNKISVQKHKLLIGLHSPYCNNNNNINIHNNNNNNNIINIDFKHIILKKIKMVLYDIDRTEYK